MFDWRTWIKFSLSHGYCRRFQKKLPLTINHSMSWARTQPFRSLSFSPLHTSAIIEIINKSSINNQRKSSIKTPELHRWRHFRMSVSKEVNIDDFFLLITLNWLLSLKLISICQVCQSTGLYLLLILPLT